jgi:Lipocalin-like domain
MRRTQLVLFTMAVILAACTPQGTTPEPTAESEPANAADATNPLVGSWSLVSWTRPTEDGETIYPYGEDAFGRITYLPNGRMAVVLMRRDRPTVSADRAEELTPEERSTLASGFFAYSGRYSVNEDEQTVTHHIEACINPNWVGTDRVRTFERTQENQIKLTTTELSPQSELIWQREE